MQDFCEQKIAADPLMYNEDNEAYLWLPTSLDDAAYKLLIVFAPTNFYVDIRFILHIKAEEKLLAKFCWFLTN